MIFRPRIIFAGVFDRFPKLHVGSVEYELSWVPYFVIRLDWLHSLTPPERGSDYPHIESTWHRSRQFIEESLADCTEEEKTKIVGGNAARIYRHSSLNTSKHISDISDGG